MVLEREAEEIPEGEPVLVVGIDVECWVYDAGRGVFEDGVWDSIMKACPVR